MRGVQPPKSGEDLFSQLDNDGQLEVLGPQKFGDHKAGKIQLQDLVGQEDDPRWWPRGFERNRDDALSTNAARRAGVNPTGSGTGGNMPPNPPPYPPNATGDDDADYKAMRDWARWHWTTYSHSPQSQALKEAVRLEFGLSASVHPPGLEVDQKALGRLRGVVGRIYDETQASLRRADLSQVYLHRGLTVPVERYRPSALEAWSEDRAVAKRFAEGDEKRILEGSTPAEFVFMWHGGPGWRPGFAGKQSEFLVLSEVLE